MQAVLSIPVPARINPGGTAASGPATGGAQ